MNQKIRLIGIVCLIGVIVAGFFLTEYSLQDAQAQPVFQSDITEPACDLLDNPEEKGKISGSLETKLMVQCGRITLPDNPLTESVEHILGPAQTDVLVNNPTSDIGMSTTQSETSIAVNPTTGTICSTYNDSQHWSIGGISFAGYSSSTDGGVTFVDHGAIPTGGGGNSFGDPSLVWRASDGNFYFASLHSNGLGLWRSNNDCTSMVYHSMIHTGSVDDREMMAVDNNPDSPFYGRLYVAWVDFAAGARVYLSYSDNTTTWSTPLALSASSVAVQAPWPAIDPNTGDLYVAWVRWNPYPSGPIDIEVVRSTNGGVSFNLVTNPLSAAANPYDITATANCARPALNKDIRMQPAPQIAVGPDGALHVVYAYDPDGNGTGDVINVYHRRSIDHGDSWDPEHRLNDDSTLTDQWFPTISVSDKNVVVAAWYDRRLDPASNAMFDYYKALSYDGGLNWGPNIRVSDVSSSVPTLNPNFDPVVAACYHGDYDQQAQYNDFTYITWSDDRNIQNAHPDPDVWFDREPVPFGTLNGQVYDAATTDPIPEASVTADGIYYFQTHSAEDGSYDMLVAPDTYVVIAEAFGYQSNSITNVTVVPETITPQDIPLTKVPHYTVEGYVTDATNGWPLYASIDTNSPAGVFWTDPETGYYNISLPEAYSFNLEVSAWVPGYIPAHRSVGPLTGNISEDFALDVDLIACDAPGYHLNPTFFEDFESGYANWSMTGLWNGESELDSCGSQIAPFPSSSHAVYYGQDGVCTYNTGSPTSGYLTTVSTAYIPPNSELRLSSFEETECGGDCDYDNREVLISTNGGSTWISLGEGDTEDYWYGQMFDLSAYSGSNALIRLHFNSVDSVANSYFGWMVDNISVGVCMPPAAGGLVVGNVYNQNSLDPVVGAVVTNDSGEETTAAATPLDPNVDDAFYILYSPSGTHDFTATHEPPYGIDTASVATVNGGTVRQDFFLAAPSIALEPEILEAWLVSGTTNLLHPNGLDLINTGGVDLGFEIREKDSGSVPLLETLSIPASDGNFQRGEAAPSTGAAPTKSDSGNIPKTAPLAPFPFGTQAYSTENTNGFHTGFGLSFPAELANLGSFDTGGAFPGAGEYVDGYIYVADTSNNLYKLDPDSGAVLSTIPITAPPAAETYTGMALDPTTGIVYASSTSVSASSLFTVDLATGTSTLVGSISGSNCNIAIAIDGTGQLFGYDICTDDFWSINKSTGAGTLIGSIGFDANFGQGMGWDPVTDQIYLTAFNNSTFQAELRLADRISGNTTLVGVLGEEYPGGLCQLPWLGIQPDVHWFWETPLSGIVPAGETFNVDITFTALYPDMTTPMPLGTYNAALLVHNDVPVTGSQSTPVMMHIVSAFENPVPSFTSNSPVDIGDDVVFNNTSTEGLPPTEYYMWDFGDGQSLQTDNTDPVNHNYASPGVYTVTLTAYQIQTGVDVIFSDSITVKGYIYLPVVEK